MSKYIRTYTVFIKSDLYKRILTDFPNVKAHAGHSPTLDVVVSSVFERFFRTD